MKKKISKTKRKRKAPSKEVVQLMEKVKNQLESFQKQPTVEWKRRNPQIHWCGDVLYYKQLDPFWLSTMTGKFAGRVIKREQNIRGQWRKFLERLLDGGGTMPPTCPYCKAHMKLVKVFGWKTWKCSICNKRDSNIHEQQSTREQKGAER